MMTTHENQAADEDSEDEMDHVTQLNISMFVQNE